MSILHVIVFTVQAVFSPWYCIWVAGCKGHGRCLHVNLQAAGSFALNPCHVRVIAVKYLREVTPYFRKTSALNDINWNSESSPKETGTLGRSSSSWIERKTFPLKLCYLCKNLTMPDSLQRTFELHSPDGKSSIVLRCPDENIANQWFHALHSKVHMLTQQAMVEANEILSTAPNNSGEIKHMGWLAEQVGRTPSNSGEIKHMGWLAEQVGIGHLATVERSNTWDGWQNKWVGHLTTVERSDTWGGGADRTGGSYIAAQSKDPSVGILSLSCGVPLAHCVWVALGMVDVTKDPTPNDRGSLMSQMRSLVTSLDASAPQAPAACCWSQWVPGICCTTCRRLTQSTSNWTGIGAFWQQSSGQRFNWGNHTVFGSRVTSGGWYQNNLIEKLFDISQTHFNNFPMEGTVAEGWKLRWADSAQAWD